MEVLKNRVYKHFKGDYYIVLDIAKNSEDLSDWVVYRSLYDEGKLYIRSVKEFNSPVDKNKYPNVEQKERFKLVEIESVKK